MIPSTGDEVYKSGMVTRRTHEEKIKRGILLSFSSRLNTQTLLALTVSETPRLPPFHHTRRMCAYRWGLGETCMYVYIYYICNDLAVPRKTENSCTTLFLCCRCYRNAFFALLPQTPDCNIMYKTIFQQKKINRNRIAFYFHT